MGGGNLPTPVATQPVMTVPYSNIATFVALYCNPVWEVFFISSDYKISHADIDLKY